MSGPILPLRSNSSGGAARQTATLADVLRSVLRRAQDQDFVMARDIRRELAQFGLGEHLWKEVIDLAGPALACRRGRYYFVPPGCDRMRVRVHLDQRQQLQIHRSVRWMLRHQKAQEKVQHERRVHKRSPFPRSVEVETEDRETIRAVTREISLSGIRLLADRNLHGQELRVRIGFPEAGDQVCSFRVRVLWSAAVGDHLHENGGVFLEKLEGS
jgi:hypothetical protein